MRFSEIFVNCFQKNFLKNSIKGTIQENRLGLPNSLRNKIKVNRNGRVVEIANPRFKTNVFPRGAMYFEHTADGLASMVAWRDNRVKIFIKYQFLK